MNQLFKILSTAANIYALACVVRIALTWFRGVDYSSFGQMLSSICDPYLNLFRRLPLRFVGLDFSPAVAITVLGAASSLLGAIGVGGALRVGGILAMALYFAWQLVSSIVSMCIVVLGIRLFCILVYKSYSTTFWQPVDNVFSPILFKITRIFTPTATFKSAVIAGIVAGILFNIVGKIAVRILCGLVQGLPF